MNRTDNWLSTDFGEVVVDLRNQRRWTQGELARRCDPPMDQAMLARIENGAQSRITLATLYRIARAFECSPCELLPEERDPREPIPVNRRYGEARD